MTIVLGVTADAIMGLLETKRQEDPNATVKLSAADGGDARSSPWVALFFFRNA
jgi:hypothetical protein